MVTVYRPLIKYQTISYHTKKHFLFGRQTVLHLQRKSIGRAYNIFSSDDL